MILVIFDEGNREDQTLNILLKKDPRESGYGPYLFGFLDPFFVRRTMKRTTIIPSRNMSPGKMLHVDGGMNTAKNVSDRTPGKPMLWSLRAMIESIMHVIGAKRIGMIRKNRPEASRSIDATITCDNAGKRSDMKMTTIDSVM